MVDLQRHLHAALLAWSLNIGPTRMAEGDCTSVRRHVTAPSRRRALRSTDRLHEQGEPSGAAPIGVDTSASAGLRHKRGRPAHGPRPAFVLRRNSTTARQETRFARTAGEAAPSDRTGRAAAGTRCALGEEQVPGQARAETRIPGAGIRGARAASRSACDSIPPPGQPLGRRQTAPPRPRRPCRRRVHNQSSPTCTTQLPASRGPQAA